jgi:phospholipid/cholesterol/gamma-HCH transport system substrate-binding protein
MVLAQLAVFAAISVLVVYYAVFGLLHVSFTNRPFHVQVDLATAGGVFEGAEVAYRGVQVGKVDAVDLHTGGVTIDLAIDHGTKIPATAIAHVYDLSAVGEQYVDLEPKGSTGPHLHGGSRIPRSHTTTPLETATVLYDLERFIDSIDPHDLQVIGREGALALQGTGPQLKSILSDTNDIVNQLSASEDGLIRLLHNSALLLHGAAAHAGAFDRFTSSLRALTGTLAAKTPTIDAFIRQGETTTRLVNSVMTDNGSAVTALLGNLATLSGIQSARIPGLRALLLAVPEFGRLAPTIVHDGSLLGIADVNQDQPLCNTGLPLSNPISGTRTPMHSVGCGPGLVRGAANAPRPAGGAAPDAAAQTRLGPSARPAGNATQVGTYDPQTGLVSTSAGPLIRLGSTGGQDRLLGDNSWQAIVLAAAMS